MVSSSVVAPKNMLIELEETFDSDGYLRLQKNSIQNPLKQPDFLTAD